MPLASAMAPPPRILELQALLSQTDWVRNLARTLVRDPHLADDLAQEACLAALRHRPATDRSLRAWLGTVLRNLVRQDARAGERRSAREHSAARAEATPSASELVERVSAHRLVVDAVMELPEPYRTVLLMRYFEDLSPKAIADRLGEPVATVKTRLARGLERMRYRFEREHGGEGRSWLAALVPLVERPRALTPTLGVLVVSTQLKIAAVTIALAAGLVFAWPDGAPDEPEVTLAAAPPAEVLEPAEPLLLVDTPATVERRAAAAQSGEPGDPVASEQPTAQSSLALPLRGRVFGADGEPLAGVRVRFDGASASNWVADLAGATAAAPHAISLADGAFELQGVAGPGSVISDSPELVTVYAGQVTVNRADAELIVVVAPRHPLAGRVLDEAGRALEGALVHVVLPAGFRSRFDAVMDYSNKIRLQCKTDEVGAFDLDIAPRIEDATIRAELNGYLPVSLPMPDYPDGAMEITLRRPAVASGTLSGQVVDPEGRPVAEAYVSYGIELARSDESGFFRFDMLSVDSPNRMAERMGFKTKRLLAVKAGFLPAEIQLPPPGAGEEEWPDRILLQLGGPPLSLAGRVVDTHGEPLAGIRVWVTDTTMISMGRGGGEMLENILAGTPERRWNPVETDAHGDFEIGGLAARAYTLAAMDPATLLRIDSDPVVAGGGHVTMTLDDSALWKRVAGRVASKDGRPVPGISIYPMTDSFRAQYQGQILGTNHSSTSGVVTDADGGFVLENVPRELVYLRLNGEDIISVEYGRHVEGGLAKLAGSKLEELEIIVPMRIHLQVTLASPESADALEVLDEAGERITINVIQGSSRNESPRVPILEGTSDVLTVTDSAATLVLYLGNTEVTRMPLELAPGELNKVRL